MRGQAPPPGHVWVLAVRGGTGARAARPPVTLSTGCARGSPPDAVLQLGPPGLPPSLGPRRPCLTHPVRRAGARARGDPCCAGAESLRVRSPGSGVRVCLAPKSCVCLRGTWLGLDPREGGRCPGLRCSGRSGPPCLQRHHLLWAHDPPFGLGPPGCTSPTPLLTAKSAFLPFSVNPPLLADGLRIYQQVWTSGLPTPALRK